MDSVQASRLWIALAVSVGLHIFVAIIGEMSSSPAAKKIAQSPPIEISRVALDGTRLPNGPGRANFNSSASVPDQAFGEKYRLDAGVPQNIPIPVPRNSSQTPTNPNQGAPVNTAPPQSQAPNPPANQAPTEFFPPMNGGANDGAGRSNSQPLAASSAGNQGQKRSRGPNRIAFPEFTVEPTVPTAMIVPGVTNSVDVTVDIAADGTHSEKIVRSSGNNEVDEMVLDALRQWRWDPAAREGLAIASGQNFKFTFKPR